MTAINLVKIVPRVGLVAIAKAQIDVAIGAVAPSTVVFDGQVFLRYAGVKGGRLDEDDTYTLATSARAEKV